MRFRIFILSFISLLLNCTYAYCETEAGTLTEEIESQSSLSSRVHFNYLGILYGPPVKNVSTYQPDINGDPDTSRPVSTRNFLGLGYSLTDNIFISGNAFWLWQPVLQQQFEMRDPFLKITHSSIFSVGNMNLYADVRVHFPISEYSRSTDLRGGLQVVQSLTYYLEPASLLLGIVASERINYFGGQGVGNDLELYLAPNLFYYFYPKLALSVLFEFQGSHTFGNKAFLFNDDGADIEPGLLWEITPNLTFNPYLHIPVNVGATLASTSIGMMLSWAI